MAGQLADQEIAQGENGPDLFPEAAVARYQNSGPETPPRRSRSSYGTDRRTPISTRHGRLTSIGDMSIHPASFRQDIIAASRSQMEAEFSSENSTDDETTVQGEVREDTPLLKKTCGSQAGNNCQSPYKRPRRGSGIHQSHNHNKPKKAGKKHGHSHGDMGMNAMVLHVLGDALGNVGVIITALIIWLTDWPGRFYADPAVSLFITLIILKSAIPLTVAASKILLQATPEHIDLNDVREDIQALPGVVSCHHVHIWQLSDTKVVASMHIQVAFPISEASGEKFMELSKMARKCLHAYGIHSATIQPEFCLDPQHGHRSEIGSRLDGASGSGQSARCGSSEGGDVCLLECVDDCVGQGCCSPGMSRPESRQSSTGHAHDHAHDHEGDHSHDHDH